jgi:photosystem II stability/assembly factor-like uncharacterized protein
MFLGTCSIPRSLLWLLSPLLLTTVLSAQTWQRVGLQGVSISSIATIDGRYFASGPQSLYQSSNGTTWDRVASGGFRHIQGGNGIIVGAGNSALAISTDNGTSWQTLSGGELLDSLGVIWSLAVDAPNGVIYLGTTGALLRSTDSGSSWVSVSEGLPADYPHVGAVALLADGSLVAGSQGIFGGSVFHLSAGSEQWVPIYSRPQGDDGEPTAVAGAPSGAIIASISTRGILRSTDMGSTWSTASTDLGDRESIRSFARRGDVAILAVTSTGRVLESTDDGVTWRALTADGLPVGGAMSVTAGAGGRLFAATSSGVFELASTSGVVDHSADAAISIAPNPTLDGTVRIRRVKGDEAARYSVCNAAGRIVRTGEMPAGTVSCAIDGLPASRYTVTVVDSRGTTSVNIVVVR